MDNIKIKILGNELILMRLTLKGWTALEGIKKGMDDAVSTKDFDNYFIHTVRFIETASLPLEIDWEKVPWYEVAYAYSTAVKLNTPTIEFPILKGNKEDNKRAPWEYDGRAWFFWLNLFAGNYGWTEDKIAELDIDTAIGLYQEISLDDQLDKEWEYGLSEISYPYNSSTKKQEFKPLQRPAWMSPLIPKQLPIVRMRKDMMPQGNIVDLSLEPIKSNKHGI